MPKKHPYMLFRLWRIPHRSASQAQPGWYSMPPGGIRAAIILIARQPSNVLAPTCPAGQTLRHVRLGLRLRRQDD